MLSHVEIYVGDLARSRAFYAPLLRDLGYQPYQEWEAGCSFRAADGHYLVFVQTEAQFLAAGFCRRRIGLNHLAFRAPSPARVDELRAAALARGGRELYPERFPHAGGQDVYAFYCADPDGIKVEIVAPQAHAAH